MKATSRLPEEKTTPQGSAVVLGHVTDVTLLTRTGGTLTNIVTPHRRPGGVRGSDRVHTHQPQLVCDFNPRILTPTQSKP